ncbi:MAG TPA: twin-arginine translocation signal domain-containing protein [Sedimentisphaerales bacterium]|nr:twin-arginine translocation signal domain-containing protein [Sedimentisphaerales bacterium]
MNRRDFIKTSLGAAICGMAFASGQSPGRRPSILWITMDERVADRNGALYNLKNDPGERIARYGRPEHAGVIPYPERLCRQWDRATM